MKIRFKSLVGLTILSVFGSVMVNAAPTINPVTGHYYEVIETVASDDISWVDADTASAVVFMGVTGHLATITSSAEDEFVRSLAVTASASQELWIGGSQPFGSAEPGFEWQWVNGEGAISTTDVPLPSYSNWLGSEPNNVLRPLGPNPPNLPDEDHLAIGLLGYSVASYGWNDEGALGNISGYVIEWDVPRVIEDCEVSAGGCETIDGHTLTFPENALPAGTAITFNDFEFTDPRASCGVESLTIFGNDTDPGGTKPDLIIPAYLCGSPKFVVIALDTGGTFVQEGTVLVENDTATVLPDNIYPDGGVSACEDPIFQNPFTDGDPQYQDVVVWQTTDASQMREDSVGPITGSPNEVLFTGAAGEFTDGCGSSRGRTKGGSYFVIGLRIDFGAGNEWENFPENNFAKFVSLTRYKLELLLDSVEEASDIQIIVKKGDRKKMRNMVANAIKNLDNAEYDSALDHVENFLKFVNKAEYVNINENFNGEHLMRGSNAEFMLRVKIIPYAP